jgi:hypothetical protein
MRERAKSDPFLTPHTKWLTALCVGAKATQLSGQNGGANLHDLRLGSDVLDVAPNTQAAKEEKGEVDFVKIKNIPASRTPSESKEQALGKGTTVTTSSSDPVVVCRAHKESLQPTMVAHACNPSYSGGRD